MKAISKMTQAEVAAFVQSHLRKHKTYATLSGGAAVSIYTVNRCVSSDIDLVEDAYADRSKIKIAMEEIGFREKNRYFIGKNIIDKCKDLPIIQTSFLPFGKQPSRPPEDYFHGLTFLRQ